MKKYIFTAGCCLLILASCARELVSDLRNTDPIPTADIILQKRNPGLTNMLSNPKINRLVRSSDNPTPLDHPFRYLGYTYKFGNYIVGHSDNIGRQIIDVQALYLDPVMKGYSDVIPILTTDAKTSAYASYDRFEKNTEMTKKVESGFSINLGLFSLGRKKMVSELFKTNTVNLSQELTGEVDLMYTHSRVWLDNVSGAQKRIAANYMNSSFISELYNTPIANIMENWGPYIVSHYYTGGRANALYVGNYKENTSFEQREKDMDLALKASYTWKPGSVIKDTVKASLNFGYNYKSGNSDALASRITNVSNRIRISGGEPQFQLTSPSAKVEENKIDLTGWLSSLKDVKTHVVVNLADGGLVGMDKFVLEENFKRRIRDTHMGNLNDKEYQIPYIEIVKIFVRNSPSGGILSDIAAVLTTRNGDKIVLSDGNAVTATDAQLMMNNDPTYFMTKATAIASDKAQYYQCEIRTNITRVYRPYIRVPLVLELKKFNEANVFKYKNPKTNIWYVYNTQSRTAFSFLDEEYIPWTYGIVDWVENVPVKNISMSTLYQLFTIVGL
ncbi:hypothetical protein BAZ12_13690 [Elizabethkingia miricola]|uniref:MACPF domain-containing protein n=1 Tax=Elizabethkingia miricola TaxID=172045 RepID=A0ABD4DS88_ELIMR|nr:MULTISPECIES: hypothetical protein [Elizabethkingia]KUY21184.1 hypothetical protein ATB95_09885 [Elizabethkingia miricola]MCL1654057.1 hypothetical protein [Elizabethkingia miricola]OPC70803.1 hypothetical protein BAZ12_13690 [Elizabethkingia miricola]OPC74878.1 hypothetical protein BAZ13_18525 [Elizabethkingia miricola]QCO48518.1 hypothetical protein FCS00_19905 [Elizabethkingia sp. 2-6]